MFLCQWEEMCWTNILISRIEVSSILRLNLDCFWKLKVILKFRRSRVFWFYEIGLFQAYITILCESCCRKRWWSDTGHSKWSCFSCAIGCSWQDFTEGWQKCPWEACGLCIWSNTFCTTKSLPGSFINVQKYLNGPFSFNFFFADSDDASWHLHDSKIHMLWSVS